MRDPKSDPVSSLEIHLHRLEKLENNQRKQRRNFLALAIATLVAVGGLWFMKPQQGPDTSTFVVFSAKQFQENEVTKVLNEENSAVVLVDYDSHMRDTLTKLEDFENWVAKNQVKYATQEVEELEETPDLNHGQPSTDIQAILLIVGKKLLISDLFLPSRDMTLLIPIPWILTMDMCRRELVKGRFTPTTAGEVIPLV